MTSVRRNNNAITTYEYNDITTTVPIVLLNPRRRLRQTSPPRQHQQQTPIRSTSPSSSSTVIIHRFHNLQSMILSISSILFLLLGTTVQSTMAASSSSNNNNKQNHIILKAGKIPGDTFDGFQLDLLDRITQFAYEMDNITLEFIIDNTTIQELYTENLDLIGPNCNNTTTINDIEYNCNNYDFIIGDYWPNPSRYEKVDFTPAWLYTSLSAVKLVEKTKKKYPTNNLVDDVTTLHQATLTGSPVCVLKDSYAQYIVSSMYPNLNLLGCNGPTISSNSNCMTDLKNGFCSLWVSDELVLRKIQSDDSQLTMTGEQFRRQWLAWPVNKNLDPYSKFLLNKYMYAAISNQTIAELYFEYFEKKKLCPIGLSGKDCELSCNPNNGRSNPAGKCVCKSTRWTGDDCSIEVLEERNEISSSLIIVASVMFGFNVLIIMMCAIWLYSQRTTSQVRASQPYFLLLVLLGCLISSSTILAMAKEGMDGGSIHRCMAIPWLYSVGFSITFGTLFGKILRVYRIFKHRPITTTPAAFGGGGGGGDSSISNSTRQQNPVTAQQTCVIIGLVLLVDVIILILWTVIDPLEWQRFVVRADIFGESLESKGYCTSDSWKIFIGFILALHVLLLAIASCMCLVARNIPTKYSEHKFVSIAIFSNLQIFVVGIPVLIIVGGDPETSFFVRSVIIWINDLAIVTLIFGNLMYSVHKSSSSRNNDSTQQNSIHHHLEQDKAKLVNAIRKYSPTTTSPKPENNSSQPVMVIEADVSVELEDPLQEDDEDEDDPESPPNKVNQEVPALKHAKKSPSRRPLISSLSSASSSSTIKRVSFSGSVSFNDIEPASEHEFQSREGSQRFSIQPTQGPPLKPRRQSKEEVEPNRSSSNPALHPVEKRPGDSPILLPLRHQSEDETYNLVSPPMMQQQDEPRTDAGTPDQRQIQYSKQNSSSSDQDTMLTKPTRFPSEFELSESQHTNDNRVTSENMKFDNSNNNNTHHEGHDAAANEDATRHPHRCSSPPDHRKTSKRRNEGEESPQKPERFDSDIELGDEDDGRNNRKSDKDSQSPEDTSTTSKLSSITVFA